MSSQTPRSTDIRNKNNYTKWSGALVCAYLPVDLFCPQPPWYLYLPCLPRAHGPALAGSRSAANAVPSCLSPWTPCDNTVATKEENLRRKQPIERRTGGHREKRATCRRPATKSPFKRTFCEVNVGRATTTTNGKHTRRKLRSTRDPPLPPRRQRRHKGATTAHVKDNSGLHDIVIQALVLQVQFVQLISEKHLLHGVPTAHFVSDECS